MRESIDECSQSFLTYIIGHKYEGTNINADKEYSTKASLHKEKLISYALTGKITKFKIRPTIYKFLLRQLHIEKGFDIWIDQQFNNYKDYNQLKNEFLNKNSIKKLKSNSDDPLNWDSLYKTNELKHLIQIDVERTNPELEYFQKEETKQMLFNVLYTYTLSLEKKTNGQYSYKQGMNEILSVFLLALYPYYFTYNKYSNLSTNESMQNIKNELLLIYKSKLRDEYIKTIYLFFHNEKFLESDLFFLFSSFMSKSMLDLYSDEKEKLIKRCDIIEEKIKLLDIDLYNHFQIIDLKCGIFLERWFKCVFCREFPSDQCLIIWDAIISNNFIEEITKEKRDYDFGFIDYICIAMIENERELLLLKEEDECLSLLLHYPEKKEIFEIVKLAEDKKVIYGDLLKKKEKLLKKEVTKEKKDVNQEIKEMKGKKGNKLIPENEFDSDDEGKFNQSVNLFNFNDNNSLSAFLNNAELINNGKENIFSQKSYNKKKKKIEMKEDVQVAVQTIENLYNKYKKNFQENDQKSFEYALKKLKNFNE